ncbi:P-loop containing nucleoside triphosphate hydrolase [Abortiporus biennis]
MPTAAFSTKENDPLAQFTAPPPNETEEQKITRLREEAEAKRISDAIDEELQQEDKASKKGTAPVKILLLGQSESGKSTTLKNFQLMNSPKTFKAERASWRAVIQLNVVRSIRLILEAMAEIQALNSGSTSRPPTSSGALQTSPSSSSGSPIPRLTHDHLKLRMRLMPLLQVEEVLIRKLTPAGSGEFEATHLAHVTNIPGPTLAKIKEKEVAVNSQFAWKGVFNKFISTTRESFDSESIDWDDPEDPGRVIYACGEDMIRLWKDPTIRQVLRNQELRLEDQPGFFLDCLDRITQPKYMPTNDDILRARLKTLGVTEYKFTIKEENRLGLGGITREWKIYDVGGQRSLVTAWAPYFDDVNVILFLAPISAFDQVLAEDPSVNRLEDSVILWKSIVSNQLLFKTNIVLFLNKIDIMKAKLQSGIRFAEHIISYGDRPNDYENTSSYLKRKFQQIFKEHSPKERPFYCHFTNVSDPKATSLILTDVQDTIIRRNLVL